MQKVVLVDDHTLILNSLKKLVDGISGFVVTHTFTSGLEFIEFISKYSDEVDLVLLDIKMPEMNGIEVLEKMNELDLSIKVLPLSMEFDESIILKMIKLGSKGYLLKNAKLAEFEMALNNVVKQGFHYSDVVKRVLLKEVTVGGSKKLSLTDKQLVFLEYVCSDLTYKQIATKMFLSPKTIDGYREEMFKKFKVKSRVGLALEVVKMGYITLK